MLTVEMCSNAPRKCKIVTSAQGKLAGTLMYSNRTHTIPQFIDHVIECKCTGCELTKMLKAMLEAFKRVAKVKSKDVCVGELLLSRRCSKN